MKDLIRTRIARKIAYMLPRRVLYYCIIRILVELTTEVYRDKTPDEISLFMALNYLEKGWELA